jgi:uncharacterized coiled-coil protein SlyX
MPLWRTLKRKFGIAAPRVAVRTHLAWYWRWLGIAAAGVLVVGIGWATYDFGMTFAGFRRVETDQKLAKLNETVARQQQEIGELRSQVAQAERQLQIERATYGDVTKQVKSLTEENATLKDDLAFFQSLMPVAAADGAVGVNRFRVEPSGMPGEYRYRLLLVHSGQRVKEFRGSLQFMLNVTQDGKERVLTLPQAEDRSAKEFQLNFKLFQRIEGTFKVPPQAVVRSMQVRVFESGSNAPKLTQTVKVS